MVRRLVTFHLPSVEPSNRRIVAKLFGPMHQGRQARPRQGVSSSGREQAGNIDEKTRRVLSQLGLDNGIKTMVYTLSCLCVVTLGKRNRPPTFRFVKTTQVALCRSCQVRQAV